MTEATYQSKCSIWLTLSGTRVHDSQAKGQLRAHILIHSHKAVHWEALASAETSEPTSSDTPSPDSATNWGPSVLIQITMLDTGFRVCLPFSPALVLSVLVQLMLRPGDSKQW